MKIKILLSGINDLSRGREFYEKQSQGLGDYFLNSIFSDIDSLALYAGIHPLYFGYHRMLSRRFPYAVYYTFEDGASVTVWRILDMRRNPQALQKDLQV
ncbi:MAG TPA: type II toxin-antitoxin system RelE/ParE family toxin [Spirochaetota bacterium]|nr:type II toxin-antitoxin system RelE/ParE family toxin [Spirochaetota bacterium]HRZ28785.1 type II toxin-antitoxin system RelE/ParE family toxin [Spirochaetota bacterium]HSA16581.1 type II toxin-antitoxin system RelE/ParE family toxin [Spirochaetota bacterium]